MTQRIVFWGLLVLWALSFGTSLLGFLQVSPGGRSLDRGLDLLSSFMSWQFFAAILALSVWIAGKGLIPIEKWLSRLPVTITLLLILGIAGLFLWASMQSSAPPDPPPIRPVTEPANN